MRDSKKKERPTTNIRSHSSSKRTTPHHGRQNPSPSNHSDFPYIPFYFPPFQTKITKATKSGRNNKVQRTNSPWWTVSTCCKLCGNDLMQRCRHDAVDAHKRDHVNCQCPRLMNWVLVSLGQKVCPSGWMIMRPPIFASRGTALYISWQKAI